MTEVSNGLSATAETPGTLHCPACGGVNDADAVFCVNSGCGKALGEFRYVTEEIRATTGFIERIADLTNRVAGWPHFFTLHVVWFGVWLLVNTGLLAIFGIFDSYPFDGLGIVLSIEATLLASLLLISNNRQNEYTNKRAELDYEVNIRAYRKLLTLERQLQVLLEQRQVERQP